MSEVKVEVDGEIYSIPYEFLEGSRTIQDLLNYSSLIDTRIPIPIPISKIMWESYLDFLSGGHPHSDALKVIDYFDNIAQLNIWAQKIKSKYSLTIKQIQQELEQTNFTLADVDIFPLTSTIDEMLPLIQTRYLYNTQINSLSYEFIGNLPTSYIKHILTTLFTHSIVETAYLQSLKYPHLSEVLKDVYMNFMSAGFIVVNLDKTEVNYIKSELFSARGGIDSIFLCYDKDRPELISPRVAERYYNINVFKYGDNMFLCPKNKPYLHDEPMFEGHKITGVKLCCINKKSGIERILIQHNNTSQLNNWNNIHDTQIHIRDYNKDYILYSFNKPSTYNRDYYLYVVYEYDPIDNRLIAFSI